MAETAEFCRYPGDVARCREALAAAWREGALESQCVMRGL